MRILSFKGLKPDKKYLIAVIITLICAIVCGIVLYNLADMSFYFNDYAQNYVYCVFIFNNGELILPHFFGELFYLYIVFILAFFTKFKYLTLIPIFVKGLFFTLYAAVLFELNMLGGISVALIVYVPISLVSFSMCYLLSESCKIINKKIVFFFPAILAVINTLLFLLLINVVFRLIIVIV